jgi:hypothetical protein
MSVIAPWSRMRWRRAYRQRMKLLLRFASTPVVVGRGSWVVGRGSFKAKPNPKPTAKTNTFSGSGRRRLRAAVSLQPLAFSRINSKGQQQNQRQNQNPTANTNQRQIQNQLQIQTARSMEHAVVSLSQIEHWLGRNSRRVFGTLPRLLLAFVAITNRKSQIENSTRFMQKVIKNSSTRTWSVA